MREFNETEKSLIKELIKCSKPCIGDFISDSILEDRGIFINRERKEICLIFQTGDSNALYEFFDILALLDYLEKERLIFVHTNPNPFPGNFLSKNWKEPPQNNKNNINRIYIPTNVFDILIRYINSFYYPVSELRMLVENNFETLEKKQLIEAKIQTKYTKLAFYITLFALLLTMSNPIFSRILTIFYSVLSWIFTIVYSVFFK